MRPAITATTTDSVRCRGGKSLRALGALDEVEQEPVLSAARCGGSPPIGADHEEAAIAINGNAQRGASSRMGEGHGCPCASSTWTDRDLQSTRSLTDHGDRGDVPMRESG